MDNWDTLLMMRFSFCVIHGSHKSWTFKREIFEEWQNYIFKHTDVMFKYSNISITAMDGQWLAVLSDCSFQEVELQSLEPYASLPILFG